MKNREEAKSLRISIWTGNYYLNIFQVHKAANNKCTYQTVNVFKNYFIHISIAKIKKKLVSLFKPLAEKKFLPSTGTIFLEKFMYYQLYNYIEKSLNKLLRGFWKTYFTRMRYLGCFCYGKVNNIIRVLKES